MSKFEQGDLELKINPDIRKSAEELEKILKSADPLEIKMGINEVSSIIAKSKFRNIEKSA